ncbi:hypothetical protein RKD39_005366 [Streptomyces albogriseolus]
MSSEASTWSTPFAARSRPLHSASSPAFSSSGTVNGSIPYDDTQVFSACTGSSASSTLSSAPAARITCADSFAMATAWEATFAAASRVRSTPDAKPQAPPCTTRTAYPRSVVSDEPAGRASLSRQEALRTRSRRKSACSAPSARARASAASARGRSGRAVKASSML